VPVQPPQPIPGLAQPPAQPPALPPLRCSAHTRTAPTRDDNERFNVSSYNRKGKQPAAPPQEPVVPIGDVEAGGAGDNEQPPEWEEEQAEIVKVSLSEPDPQSYEEAMCTPDRDGWLDAMDEEFFQLTAMDTYDLVECPPDHKPIGTRWVYHRKRDAEGEIIRLRARFVAQIHTDAWCRFP